MTSWIHLLGAKFALAVVVGGVTFGVSVSFLQAKKNTERDRIKNIFFMRLNVTV
jgi:hypothetical protein